MLTAINQLPGDTTTEDALEVLMILWKVEKSLQEDEGVSQKEVKQHFLNRRTKRKSEKGN